jgi:hypothetical protein
MLAIFVFTIGVLANGACAIWMAHDRNPMCFISLAVMMLCAACLCRAFVDWWAER